MCACMSVRALVHRMLLVYVSVNDTYAVYRVCMSFLVEALILFGCVCLCVFVQSNITHYTASPCCSWCMRVNVCVRFEYVYVYVHLRDCK